MVLDVFCDVLSRSQPVICMFVQVQSSMLYWPAIVTATFSRAIRSCIIFRSESDDYNKLLLVHVRIERPYDSYDI